MPFSPLTVLSGIGQAMLEVFSLTWWIIIPAILLFIFWEIWLNYIRFDYFKNIKWVMLRVKTPKEVLKTPKAMEQVFAVAHSTYSHGLKFLEKYWKGKLELWTSFEIVGDANGVYFYIRINDAFRDMIEAAIYSQYPNAEIEKVDDYTGEMPSVLPNDTYDVFGADFILAKENAYPIRTYPYFESNIEEEKLDAIATIVEVMSKLKEGERIWLQLIVRPTGDDWKKESEKVRDALIGRKAPTKKGLLDAIMEFIINLIQAPFKEPVWSEEAKPEKPSLISLTKGEQEVIKAIEDKASKIGFEAALRFVYIDDRSRFSRNNVAAIMGALRQFNTLNLNGLKPYKPTLTTVKGLFKQRRLYFRKRQIYDAYRLRMFPPKFSIFNVEELATLYHYPSTVVEAPMLRPVEFKKGAPPTNLPYE